ncbi:aspartyl protease family protein [Pseudoalteromonas luteoviolacea]|uniref:PDZ domain-containing protein n=1 Tax=Pseudoalteromonas luteoviolacea S4054 TaxID=1129367 RepID=A0A0F6ABJ8_9GAMM|nr:aspartyl protease family protein [Pseudoalteromonas luteoviolacea]AOT08848.1 hypothetical protein S4054249_13720 [Pseudoalteromonas luteoviolacea]AOT13761.1 hypothetical protein S40542_13690 [Pseudoalteromonas luteoviolacea]AOT18675.1 hypothetical protein S4054_13695 [Pseudoalteromonas luteoviolacea]KKE83587.1 hypothetical protein N479_13080 [Pseudoalteromonas luteoviolacea S4054]KZN72776.1 hypothetical protein N481_14215 [Pseudoalteromonas luteoviolacea S4047-1]
MKLLILLLGTMVLSGCSVANYLRLKYENDDLEPNWQAGKTYSQLDADISAKPYVFITINGVSGFKMMIDTGASISLLEDTSKVKALGLKEGYPLELGGWGDGENSRAYQTQVSQIKLGDVSFDEVSFAFMPLSQTDYFLRPEEAVFDGVLGHDILKHFTWYIDPKKGTVAISKAPYQSSQEDLTIPMRVFLSKLYFDSEIDLGDNQMLEQEVVLDTGSRHYFKLNNYYVRDAGLEFKGKTVTGSDFGLNGQTVHQRGTVPQVKIGDLTLTNVQTNFIEGDDDGKSVLGSSALSHFSYVIDYSNLTLHLKPYQSSNFIARYNLLGLELRKLTNGAFVVRYVMPEMAAFGSGIKVGDEVVSFNGVNAKQLSQKDWITLSSTVGEHTLCITRAGTCYQLNAQHIAGYSNLQRL